MNKQTLAKNLAITLFQLRWGLSLRQLFVAEEINITQQQLSSYEKGKAIPSLLSMIALADFYDVSIDYLVGRCQNSKAHKTVRMLKYKEE